jgi:selenide,water dikinase
LSKLPKFENSNLLVGIETSDDACVYKINDDLAIIQTVDFFTPVVDDPYTFGQIAAANSLSDIYAMGGEPVLALNILGFPSCLDTDIMAEVLKGGASKVVEAGATLAGGHSIEDEEPKYGLCIMGFVHPKKILKNYGAKPQDVLILTKPIGTGIINTSIKAGIADKDSEAAAIKSMCALNKKAKEILDNYPVSSCTDITGFGLLGHGVEMAQGSQVTFNINIDKIPILHNALEYAEMGLVPGGTYRNRKYFEDKISYENIEEKYKDILFDPQTSGGLLISIGKNFAEDIMSEFKTHLDTESAIIGDVSKVKEKLIHISML